MTLQEKIEEIEIVLPEIERLCKAHSAAAMAMISSIVVSNGTPGQPCVVPLKQFEAAAESDTPLAAKYREIDAALRGRLYSMNEDVLLTMMVLMFTGITLRSYECSGEELPFDCASLYKRYENMHCVVDRVPVDECIDALVGKSPRLAAHLRRAINALEDI